MAPKAVNGSPAKGSTSRSNGVKAKTRKDERLVETQLQPADSTTGEEQLRLQSPASISGSQFTYTHLFFVALFNAFIISITLWSHYHLPTPRSISVESSTSPAHFSEIKSLEYISKLSDDIGYRIVGTKEHVEAEKWIESVIQQYVGWHRTIEGEAANTTAPFDPRGDTQVEMWTQIGNGSHQFDFMDASVFKKYYSMSNVIVRISDGTDVGKQHSVLLNSHLDSTLPSPGAADDGAGVAIQLELLRIYTTAPRPRLRHSVILLFNNGEESLQDASHLYATQDLETMPSVRGVINLEACGTSGPELLFQSTSVPFTEAYAKVPYPYGTVLANDVFSTGLILSDTDFRQFVEYGNLSGLDIAIIGDSFKYHTRLDVTSALKPGTMQHFGDNILAIVDHLTTSPQSKLSTNAPFPKKSPPIYFSIAGRYFFMVTSQSFRTVVMVIGALSNFLLTTFGRADKHFGAVRHMLMSFSFVILSLLAALVGANITALIMTQIIRKPLSWFTYETLPVLLFGPSALTAILTTQYALSSLTKPHQRPYLERSALDGLLLYFLIGLIAMNGFGIGSAYMNALGGVAVMITIAINDILILGVGNIEQKKVAAHHRLHAFSYITMSIVPASIGSEGLVSFLDLFVPLTGRTGEISPADHIVGSIVGALSFLCLPILLPLSHRMGQVRLKKAILGGLTLSVLSIALFASSTFPSFDAAHPKRVFVHQVQNLTSDTYWMNIGGADPDVKGLESIVNDVHKVMGIPEKKPELMIMGEHNTDFDILYPVSDFITPFKFPLPLPSQPSPWTTTSSSSGKSEQSFYPHASDDYIDWEAGTRRLTITMERKGIIWSVIAFDAEILEWDLSMKPPKGRQRHHLKEVSRYGKDSWSVSMLLKLPKEATKAKTQRFFGDRTTNMIKESQGVPEKDPTKLWIDYSGLLADGMWPQAKRKMSLEEQSRYPSIEILKTLDEFLLESHPEVDSMLLSVVAAVAQV